MKCDDSFCAVLLLNEFIATNQKNYQTNSYKSPPCDGNDRNDTHTHHIILCLKSQVFSTGLRLDKDFCYCH